MPKHKLINLLPQEEFDSSTLGRVLKWAMGSFRIIVIVTEMVVMGAFLSRFWLDAQNSDLNDSITIKRAQITAQKDFEAKYRDTQKKLAIVKAIDGFPKPTDKLGVFAQKMPQDVILTDMSVTDSSAELRGNAGSEIDIAQFLSNLQGDKTFTNVDLGSTNISEKDPTQTVFTIDTNY